MEVIVNIAYPLVLYERIVIVWVGFEVGMMPSEVGELEESYRFAEDGTVCKVESSGFGSFWGRIYPDGKRVSDRR